MIRKVRDKDTPTHIQTKRERLKDITDQLFRGVLALLHVEFEVVVKVLLALIRRGLEEPSVDCNCVAHPVGPANASHHIHISIEIKSENSMIEYTGI